MIKWLKACPLVAGTLLTTVALTAISYTLGDSTYASYKETYSLDDAPYFSLVFRGIKDGVFPFGIGQGADSIDNMEQMASLDASADLSPIKDSAFKGNDLSGNDVSGNDISGNDISGNDISGNNPDRTYEFQEVDPDYFCDALFIGDSRTVGLSEYCEELDTRATFYSKVSLTIYKVLTEPMIKTDSGKINVEQALTENHFGKIYIMLGLNEIGVGTPESFAENYKQVVDRIRELQPDAIIYIQGIMHVTENKSKNDKYFNNENINRRNEELKKLADNKTIFYLDMNESVDDENGNLIAELSFDDIHLKASSYERWYQFLLQHAIVY